MRIMLTEYGDMETAMEAAAIIRHGTPSGRSPVGSIGDVLA